MQYYRAYPLGKSGKIAGPPYEILAENDDQARRAANLSEDDRRLELWTGPRYVGHVIREEQRKLEYAH